MTYPKLTNKLKAKANMYHRFKCGLDPLEIPKVTAKWSSNKMLYPEVSKDIFYKYCDHKKEANHGQQEKAFRMLQSRKKASVKKLTCETVTYIKAMIKKSYGNNLRTAFLLLDVFNPEMDNAIVLLVQVGFVATY